MTEPNESVAYCLGRAPAGFDEPYVDTDKLFAGQRLDEEEITSSHFEHCTFANISFKKAKISNGKFVDCIFIGCYFRRAHLKNCQFIGCRFFDCNFNYVALQGCDFRFSTFQGCHIAFSEFEFNLPREPNLREELTRNLSLQASRLGLSQEARQYRIAEIRAREQHLRAAIVGKSKWYKDHFDGLGRAKASIQLVLSLMNRWLWGYGEHAKVLVRNLFWLAFIIFPGLFYFYSDQLSHATGRRVTLLDSLYFSLENIVPAGVTSGIVANGSMTRLLAGLESLFGVVVLALFAAYIFRWSLHR